MRNTRRQILRLFCLLPLARPRMPSHADQVEALLGDDFVLLDGWVLKKSDLPRLLQ